MISQIYDTFVRKIITKITLTSNTCRGEFNAIWDTGTEICAISPAAARSLNLSEVGISVANGTAGSLITRKYAISLIIGNTEFDDVPCLEAKLPSSVDFVIGMDIIATGKFHIENINGHTEFRFEI